MYLNNFSVRVPEGNEIHSGYVVMEHGQQYTVQIRNNNNKRCDAKVTIDGKVIGTFRLGAYSSVRLERPVHDDGKFTFYKQGTSEYYQSQLESVPQSELGLISVEFIPELIKSHLTYTVSSGSSVTYRMSDISYHGTPTNDNSTAGEDYVEGIAFASAPTTRGLMSGGTGLSGQSDQKFYNADWMQLDFAGTTTINLRLVTEKNKVRPLTQSSNPIPPPLYAKYW